MIRQNQKIYNKIGKLWHTDLSHRGALLVRTPLKNMLAEMHASTVDKVIMIMLKQKKPPAENGNHSFNYQ